MKHILNSLILAAAIFSSHVGYAKADKAFVSFESPKDGDTVTNPVVVKFIVQGMEIKNAGEMIKNTGHHHLIVDRDAIPKGQVVPMDETHIHFGKGQKETTITLSPGKHTLTLQFADGAHISYGKEMSKKISVNVKE